MFNRPGLVRHAFGVTTTPLDWRYLKRDGAIVTSVSLTDPDGTL